MPGLPLVGGNCNLWHLAQCWDGPKLLQPTERVLHGAAPGQPAPNGPKLVEELAAKGGSRRAKPANLVQPRRAFTQSTAASPRGGR